MTKVFTILANKSTEAEAKDSVARVTEFNGRFEYEYRARVGGGYEIGVLDAKADQPTIDALREVARESHRPAGDVEVKVGGAGVADAPVQGQPKAEQSPYKAADLDSKSE